jgi:hypothetical protein
VVYGSGNLSNGSLMVEWHFRGLSLPLGAFYGEVAGIGF